MRITLFLFCFYLISSVACSQTHGSLFSKKVYSPEPLPKWESAREVLPLPVLEDNPGWIEMYYKCWEIAFRGLRQPQTGSPLVSNYLDEAFSENIFQWDTIFMMMFARYAHPVFPAIQSLDNFYALQYESGFIGREFREKDSRIIHFDFDGGLFSPKGWKNAINPPLFAWAEVESFKLTGDKSRFEAIYPVLAKYAEWLDRDGDPEAEDWQNQGRKSVNTVHELYWNTPLGSGMDNTPRPAKKGSGWVEMSSQMVIMYNNLAIIAREIGLSTESENFLGRANEIGERINKWCWNENDDFYYDVLADGTQFRKKTVGGFWPLLAKVASQKQAAGLVKHLENEDEFNTLIPFATLSADEPEFDSLGGYWLGSVWAPTNVMVIKGLENYGYNEFAASKTEKYLAGMYQVFLDSNTVYENYAPTRYLPGNQSRPDFVGWTGCGPIQLLIENVMGIRADAVNNKVVWYLRRNDRHGVKNLFLGSNKISLLFSNNQIETESPESFSLSVIYNGTSHEYQINRGNNVIELDRPAEVEK